MSQERVVIAIDDSEYSMNALKFYLSTVHKPSNQLILTHSTEIPYQPVQPLREDIVQDIIARTRQVADAVEGKFKKFLQEKGIPFEIKNEFSHPGEYICLVAKESQATMIVMGTRGMGSIRRTILGSVSDYVIHHAHCPVLVFKH